MKDINVPRALSLLAFVILTSTLFLPVMSIEFRQMSLLDFAINPYLAFIIVLAFFSGILGFYRAGFNLIAGSLMLGLFLFLSLSKMHSPQYLAGYWLLLLGSILFFASYTANRLNRKAY